MTVTIARELLSVLDSAGRGLIRGSQVTIGELVRRVLVPFENGV